MLLEKQKEEFKTKKSHNYEEESIHFNNSLRFWPIHLGSADLYS